MKQCPFCHFFTLRLGIILHQTGIGHNHSHGIGGGHSHDHSHDIGGGHSHDHSHSNGLSSSHDKESSLSTKRISRSTSLLDAEKQNINVRAAFIHVLGDIVQSVGVLIAAYIIKFKVIYCKEIAFQNYK